VAVRTCVVSFVGPSGIRHSVEVEAETLFEAAVLAVTRFRQNIWGKAVTAGTTARRRGARSFDEALADTPAGGALARLAKRSL
jgi:hypothetical protein